MMQYMFTLKTQGTILEKSTVWEMKVVNKYFLCRVRTDIQFLENKKTGFDWVISLNDFWGLGKALIVSKTYLGLKTEKII